MKNFQIKKRRSAVDPSCEARCRSMRPCVKKEASAKCGDRKFGQVFRGNGDLTLPELRRELGPRADCCGGL
jgi:hypothetical protein